MTKNQILLKLAILGIMFNVVFFTPALAASKIDNQTIQLNTKDIKTISLIINRVVINDSTSPVDVDVKIGSSLSDIKKQQELERARREHVQQQAEQAKKAQIRSLYVYQVNKLASSGNAQVDELINQYAVNNNILDKAGLIKKIVYCESRGDAGAKNRYSTAGGLAQYIDSTWANTPEGISGLSKYDSNAAISAMSRDIAQGYISKWNASRHCWSR